MDCTRRSYDYSAVYMKCIWKHLVSIFVGDYYLLDDLLEVFISYIDNTIHLGFVRRRIKVLKFPLDVKFSNQLPIEILSIFNYQFCWQAVETNQILLDEPLNHLMCHMCIRDGLYLFSKVVDSHQDESMPIVGLWIDWSYDI